MVQDRLGGTPAELEKALQGAIAEGGSEPSLARVFSLYRASTPQLFVDINREQVKSLGVDLESISQTLQFYLGSIYVNEADGPFRARAEDIASGNRRRTQ